MRWSQQLNDESGKWEREGVITPEQRRRILAFYPQSEASSPLLSLFAVIGTLLIGSGVILLFAMNWYRIPATVKLALAFLPLLLAMGLGGYTLLRRETSRPFRESSALLLSLAVFAAIALIGQTFHTPSDLREYFLTCVLLTLPGVYLFDARAAAGLYTIGAAYAGWHYPLWIAIPLLLALAPLLIKWLAAGGSKALAGYLLLLLSGSLICLLIMTNDSYQMLYLSLNGLEILLISGQILLLADGFYRFLPTPYFLTPVKLLGVAVFFVLLTLYCFFGDLLDRYPEGVGLLICAVIVALNAALRLKSFRRPTGADIFAAVGLLFCLFMFAYGRYMFLWDVKTVCGLLLFVPGVYYVYAGSRRLDAGHLNFGMVSLLLVIGARFFDSELSFLSKGILSILLGAAFLTVNLLISRKKRGVSS
jgi:uncharacterized membrane protein